MSNTKKEELDGQVDNDLRIIKYKYGIAFGIDFTTSKKYLEYHLDERITTTGRFCYIIHENPFR